VRANSVILGQDKGGLNTISSGCKFFLPGFQPNTDTVVFDQSGLSRTFYPGADLTTGELWAVANKFSTEAGTSSTDNALERTGTTGEEIYNFNAGESFLFHTLFTSTTPTSANRSMFSIGNASTDAGYHGLRLSVTTAGVLGIGVDHAGGTPTWGSTNSGGAGSGVITGGSAITYAITAAVWNHNVAAGTANFYVWIDAANGFTDAIKAITGLPASIVSTVPPRLGGRKNSTGTPYQGWPFSFACVQAYSAPNSVTFTHAYMASLAQRLYRCPTVPLTSAEWPTS